MAWDIAFAFRASAGYVTDPAYGVYVLTPSGGENYPVTKTNANLDAAVCGWSGSPDGVIDRDSTWTPVLAGLAYKANGGSGLRYRIDLPSSGTYTLDIAMGDANPGGSSLNTLQVYDDTTLLVDLTNGGLGYAATLNAFIDITGASITRTAGQAWTGATVNKTFATTTLLIQVGANALTGNAVIAQFRVTAAVATGWGPLLGLQNNRLVLAEP